MEKTFEELAKQLIDIIREQLKQKDISNCKFEDGDIFYIIDLTTIQDNINEFTEYPSGDLKPILYKFNCECLNYFKINQIQYIAGELIYNLYNPKTREYYQFSEKDLIKKLNEIYVNKRIFINEADAKKHLKYLIEREIINQKYSLNNLLEILKKENIIE